MPWCALCSWLVFKWLVSVLQEELLIQLSWLMNLHIPPGRLEGSLCCLYGDRWPLALVCPCQQLCRLSVGSCANLLYCCELSSAGCEHVSTVSIGLFVLCYALFLPGLWILDMSSIAPTELLVAWGFFFGPFIVWNYSWGIFWHRVQRKECPNQGV